MLNLILRNIEHLEHYSQQLKDKYGNNPIYVTIRPIEGIEKSRKIYFAKINLFAKSLGYSSAEMHEFIKSNILPGIIKIPAHIKEGASPDMSTTCLSEAGYTALILKTEEYILKNVDRII